MKIPRSRWSRGAAWCAIMLVSWGTAGCTALRSYHAMTPPPIRAVTDLQPSSDPRTADVSFEFRSRGTYSAAVSSKWRNFVIETVRETRLFSDVRPAGEVSSTSISITMENVVGSTAGAVAQGVVSGLTFGFIGSKVTDDYAITAALRTNERTVNTKTYATSLVSTSGLIRPGVANARKYASIDGAFQDMLRQTILMFLTDLQRDRVL